MPYALCIMLYALCFMLYALCTMHYALCIMHYALCIMHYRPSLRLDKNQHVDYPIIARDFSVAILAPTHKTLP
jgi:hypothetical protein